MGTFVSVSLPPSPPLCTAHSKQWRVLFCGVYIKFQAGELVVRVLLVFPKEVQQDQLCHIPPFITTAAHSHEKDWGSYLEANYKVNLRSPSRRQPYQLRRHCLSPKWQANVRSSELGIKDRAVIVSHLFWIEERRSPL